MTHASAGWMLLVVTLAAATVAAPAPPDTRRGDRMIADYFRAETARLSAACLEGITTLEEWTSRREAYRRQLLEMLGLWPLPEKTDLNARVTGRVEHPEFIVEKVVFQSRPRLYVTGSLYLPRKLEKPAPAILYVCGHSNVKKDGISYGSKASYQHHGAWFARNGYVCLTIDTLQLGEIEGLHHGTYREKMWWWFCRGYTPAGVEAWNGIRALDYLQSRPEVDGKRLGVTGRSGGGAYSWWIAALDERIGAAVPVAGITDLENHVVDGTVEGHCDCMFIVNTYQWDYPQVAALVAPRPLLLSNSDKDPIFPLEGVIRTHARVRRIYRLYQAEDRLGLLITEGPHRDTQDLQVPAMRWFNRFLKGEDTLVENAAVRLLEPEALKVLDRLPDDQLNTTIHESFVPAAPPPAVPQDRDAWARQRDSWMQQLREKSFRGWPPTAGPLDLTRVFASERQGLQLAAWDFTSQGPIRLRLYVLHRAGLSRPERVTLHVLGEEEWSAWLAALRPAFEEELREEALPAARPDAFAELQRRLRSADLVAAWIAPRGVGPTAWDPSERKQIQHQRRFYLLGQTLDGMRVWDVRRAIRALRQALDRDATPLWLEGDGRMAGVALYAALFEPDVAGLDLRALPASHREGPFFLNVQRFMDTPAAVAMAAERCRVRLQQPDPGAWAYPLAVARQLGWGPQQIEVRPLEQGGK